MLIARLLAETAARNTALAHLARSLDGASVVEAGGVSGDGLVELRVPGANPAALLAAIDAQLGPVDVLVSAGPVMIPALFVSDMDSTMIGQECIDELADYAGIKPHIAQITERAMRGELDFEAALRQRVGLLAGLPESAIGQCLAERIAPTPGAATLVQTLKAHGCRTVLVTGGFHHFADPVAGWLGFDRVVGNRLGVENGALTGGLVGPIADSATKLCVLRAEAAALPEGSATMAAGDGANDVPMLEAATYGIAYRAKPIARKAAAGRIETGDLTALLRLLGIPEAQWA